MTEDQTAESIENANNYGWLVQEEKNIDTTNHYSLEIVVSKSVPEEIENEAKNIRLERIVFAEDDNSPMYRKAMRLVPEEEWKAKRVRYRQPPYLIMLFRMEDNHEDKIKNLLNQDLFLKESVDLRKYFSEVLNLQKGMTCTAHAGKALMEYFQNRASNRVNSQLSWRFLYKVTRDLMDSEDSLIKGLIQGGATLRDTLRAMVLFGIPPEKSDRNWMPKNDKNEEDDDKWLNKEENHNSDSEKPSAFAYAYAQNFQASNCFRLDKLRENYKKGLLTLEKDKHDIEVGQLTVAQIRIALASGFPAIFGVSDVKFINKYIKQEDLDKIEKDNQDNSKDEQKIRKLGQVIIPNGYSGLLSSNERNPKKIGHALVAVGYDDNLEFDNPQNSNKPFKGGFLFRDSHSLGAGDKGYGWMPYEYVEWGLATDWWSLLNAEWINIGRFGIGTDQILGCECGTANPCDYCPD